MYLNIFCKLLFLSKQSAVCRRMTVHAEATLSAGTTIGTCANVFRSDTVVAVATIIGLTRRKSATSSVLNIWVGETFQNHMRTKFLL